MSQPLKLVKVFTSVFTSVNLCKCPPNLVYGMATCGTGRVKHDAEEWIRREQEGPAGFARTWKSAVWQKTRIGLWKTEIILHRKMQESCQWRPFLISRVQTIWVFSSELQMCNIRIIICACTNKRSILLDFRLPGDMFTAERLKAFWIVTVSYRPAVNKSLSCRLQCERSHSKQRQVVPPADSFWYRTKCLLTVGAESGLPL
jgi:hypothetical protein